MFQGEPVRETKKPKRHVIYVEFVLRFSRFSFTTHPYGKVNTARTMPRRITLRETSIRRACELYDLEKLSLGKCIKASIFREIVNISLHNFSDASEIGYGQCSYLRVVDENENIHCSLIMGKARVAPKKFISIPRLELLASVLLVKI